tara:strand:+ start:113 stop:1111 length:999 start_codon:yes stop_codon:yes gene_type:complete
MMNHITLESPLDMHVHLRQDGMLKLVAPHTAQHFSAAVVMPNLVPPVDNLNEIHAYRSAILEAVDCSVFQPLMMLFFRPFTEAELIAAKPHIFGVKLYPQGATTNSEAGVRELKEAEPTLEIMQELGIPLMVHGETNGFVLDREKEFLTTYAYMAERFPRLKIVMEHITTREAVQLLDRYENLYATVTLHHLKLSLDDLIGGMLEPHHFCKPIVKRPEDRDALVELAVNAHPKLMFGSDSAPHPQLKKECIGGAAGIYTAPICLPLLAELFDCHGALHNLQAFVSGNAQKIHGFEAPKKLIRLERRPMSVPDVYDSVIPLFASETIAWSVVQ